MVWDVIDLCPGLQRGVRCSPRDMAVVSGQDLVVRKRDDEQDAGGYRKRTCEAAYLSLVHKTPPVMRLHVPEACYPGSNWWTRQSYTLSGREGMSLLLFLVCKALLAG